MRNHYWKLKLHYVLPPIFLLNPGFRLVECNCIYSGYSTQKNMEKYCNVTHYLLIWILLEPFIALVLPLIAGDIAFDAEIVIEFDPKMRNRAWAYSCSRCSSVFIGIFGRVWATGWANAVGRFRIFTIGCCLTWTSNKWLAGCSWLTDALLIAGDMSAAMTISFSSISLEKKKQIKNLNFAPCKQSA